MILHTYTYRTLIRMVLAPSPLERLGVRLCVVKLCGLLFCLLFTACTEVDVVRCTGGDLAGGYLMIHPDQRVYTLPGMQYYFYNMDGKTARLNHLSDANGNFEGTLPAGTYRTVAINPGVDNVIYQGLEHDDTALAGVLGLSLSFPAYGNYGILCEPGDVYVVTLGDFTVSPADTLRYTPVPVRLTRYVQLRFLLSGNLDGQLGGIEGVLGGVQHSIYLYSGQPTEESAREAPLLAVPFIARRGENGWAATVRLFGLSDPDYGTVYANTLELALTQTDGSKVYLEADLTEQLSDIIAGAGGAIPLTSVMELTLTAEEGGFTVGLQPWEPDGEESIEIF